MNRIVLSLLAFFVSFACFSQICRTGFTYEISQSPHWGYGKPVVTSVQPYSIASQNGLKTGDIIEYIDSTSVSDIAPDDIPELLNIEGKDETVLVISNLAEKERRIWIRKECKRADAVTEDQLAEAFYLYSAETCGERRFYCPFRTTTTLEPVDFSVFRTFAFSGMEETHSDLELAINDCIEQELLKKGMDMDFIDPDLLIQTFYFFDKNPNFQGKNIIELYKIPVYRYDHARKQMVTLPFLHRSAPEAEAEYILQFGFRLVDQKLSPGRVVWECEANELLDDLFTLENYARIHVPLMCMQYPYVKYTERVPFRVDLKTYNYTGLQFDLNNPARIIDVDRNSPAASLGIRRNDRIEHIEGQVMPDTWDELSEQYRNFVVETAAYRDPTTRFRHPDYATETMYWDSEAYKQVAEFFSNPESGTPFAYLFAYAPYIQTPGINNCRFVITRGNNRQEYVIRPSIRLEQSISVGR